MKLRGQRNPNGDAGYAMAALLVAMSVMAVLLTAVMPVWKQMAQREKEEELVFRGEQYVHAIQLFQRRAGPGTYPPSIDFLVQQKYLRKKYKDPITNADFVPVPAVAQTVPGAPAGTPGGSSSTTTGAGAGAATAPPQPVATGIGGTVAGGVAGVVSKSTDKSIRIYNGQTHYNEWVFRALPPTQPIGTAAPGQRGGQPGRGQGPGTGGTPGVPGGPQRGGSQRGFSRGGAGFPPSGGPGQFGSNGPSGTQPNSTPPQGGRGFTILPNGQVVPASPQQPPGR